MACRVDTADNGVVHAIDIVTVPGAQSSDIADQVTRGIREAFSLDLEPSSVKVMALPREVGAQTDLELTSEPAPTAEAESGSNLPGGAASAEDRTAERASSPAAWTTAAKGHGSSASAATHGAGTHEAKTNGGRARIENVSVMASDSRAEARVSLLYGGKEWLGTSKGPNTSGRRYRLIAEATLSGLEGILDQPGLFSLEDLKVLDSDSGEVVVAVVELTSRRAGKRLSGSCPAVASHGSVEEAVVRATLQAVNRLFQIFAGEKPPPA